VSFKALWSSHLDIEPFGSQWSPLYVFNKKLHFFSTEERKTWTSWMTWGWVNYQQVNYSFNDPKLLIIQMCWCCALYLFTVVLHGSYVVVFFQITSEIWDVFEHILFQCLDIDRQTQQPLPSTWNTFKTEIYHTWTHCLVSHDSNSSSYDILSAMFSIS